MSPAAMEAERIARAFGLTYLSAEGYEKLAALLAWVRPIRWDVPPKQAPMDVDDILAQPPARFG